MGDDTIFGQEHVCEIWAECAVSLCLKLFVYRMKLFTVPYSVCSVWKENPRWQEAPRCVRCLDLTHIQREKRECCEWPGQEVSGDLLGASWGEGGG